MKIPQNTLFGQVCIHFNCLRVPIKSKIIPIITSEEILENLEFYYVSVKIDCIWIKCLEYKEEKLKLMSRIFPKRLMRNQF